MTVTTSVQIIIVHITQTNTSANLTTLMMKSGSLLIQHAHLTAHHQNLKMVKNTVTPDSSDSILNSSSDSE